MADVLERLLALTQGALDEFGSPGVPASASLNKAIRVATLRNDFANLSWLRLEAISLADTHAVRRIGEELQPRFSRSEYQEIMNRSFDAWGSERRHVRQMGEDGQLRDTGKPCPQSLAEIERMAQTLRAAAQAAVTPTGLHPQDLYFVDQSNARLRISLNAVAQDYEGIAARIGQRIHDFLAATERELVYGQINSDIFEQNRQYVDAKLRAIAPDVLEKFVIVYRRMSDRDPEARSEAALSCRRILKSLADHVYPPPAEPVTGSDGTTRELTDDKFINRLLQFVSERTGGKRAGELLLSQVSELGTKLGRLVNLGAKGVHADIGEHELNQCVIQTYLAVGDVLRIADSDSGIDIPLPEGLSNPDE